MSGSRRSAGAQILFVGDYLYTSLSGAGLKAVGKPWDKTAAPLAGADVLPLGDLYGFSTEQPVSRRSCSGCCGPQLRYATRDPPPAGLDRRQIRVHRAPQRPGVRQRHRGRRPAGTGPPRRDDHHRRGEAHHGQRPHVRRLRRTRAGRPPRPPARSSTPAAGPTGGSSSEPPSAGLTARRRAWSI